MIGKTVAAVGLASAALLLGACTDVDLAAYEREEFPACYADQGAWAGEPPAAQYVEDSFGDFDRHFGPFLVALEQAASQASTGAPAGWARHLASLHDKAQANIVRLGRLLPRMNRPLDLAPMAGQFEEGAIWWPRGDHHTEFLGVALAEEFAAHQNLARHMTAFLSSLERVEALLLDLEHVESGDTAASRPSVAELARATRELREGWEAAEPGMRRVIFDRPDMPEGERLSERLHIRVAAICKSYSECGDGENCDEGVTSDGLTGEPMVPAS